ncbi:zinc-binding dehydrogenase [Paenibacillus kribbensis]|uniref:Alcohol dehydrogenase n=1 Tax=Paenibacillus kribbensis TaxID=172713 RepID=A0A222WM94_9BACL|nr:zinc-binding dehydrogenase [Paenibacillus kribbensis]ASR47074.1 alcohol dehydrogenase [Paenibacillus kribbensis]
MIRAIVTDPFASEFFSIKEVAAPQAQPWEAIVQVQAFSLNRGEISDAMDNKKQMRPGWDFAGVVIEQAQNGTGPKQGSRVVGLLPMGAWAEQVAAPTSLLAEIPDDITFAEAATLPVAGLSALYTLRKGGMLLGKRVLITGSTGGVGLFAHQLAAQSGAFTVGIARTEEKALLVQEAGANEVIVGDTAISSVDTFGPYHLIIDSVGGDTLAALLPQLGPEGICVSMGHSSSPYATINIRGLGGRTLYSFFLGEEINRYSPAEDLKLLGELVSKGQLVPRIEVEASWKKIGNLAQQLIERKFSGKAVLHIN